MACASAPKKGVNVAGVPSGLVTLTVMKFACTARNPRLPVSTNRYPSTVTVGRNGGSAAFGAVPGTVTQRGNWKLRSGPLSCGYASTTTRYRPGVGRVISCLKTPPACGFGCLWMITPRSLRTMIRCTPVCGPLPLRYRVSGAPEGWSIRNERTTGLPAVIRAGAKSANLKVRAAPMVICGGADEPQPASTTVSRTALAASLTPVIEATATPEPPD